MNICHLLSAFLGEFFAVAPGVRRKVIHRRRDCCEQLRYIEHLPRFLMFTCSLWGWFRKLRCFIFDLFFGKALPSHCVKMDQARETQPKGASKSIDGLLDEMEDDDGGFGEPVGESSEDQEKCGFGNRDTPKSNRFSSFHAQALTHPGSGRPDYGIWRSRAEVYCTLFVGPQSVQITKPCAADSQNSFWTVSLLGMATKSLRLGHRLLCSPHVTFFSQYEKTSPDFTFDSTGFWFPIDANSQASSSMSWLSSQLQSRESGPKTSIRTVKHCEALWSSSKSNGWSHGKHRMGKYQQAANYPVGFVCTHTWYYIHSIYRWRASPCTYLKQCQNYSLNHVPRKTHP